MPTKQIHELPAAGALDPADRIVVSTAAGNHTRRGTLADLPVRPVGAGQARRLAEKLAETVSVKDYGAVGDGIADDAPAFQAALDDGAVRCVHVPPGTYRLAATVHVAPGRRISGAGRDITLIRADGPLAFHFHRNEGAWLVDPGATTDWNRSSLHDLTIAMTTGGIKVHGHEFFADRLRFRGGQPTGWCIELEDANECSLREIAAGTGGGANDLEANGIWFWAGSAINYGDSLLEEIAIKLKRPNTVGIKIEHTNAAAPDKVMNNLLLSRVQVNAAGTAPAGSVGVWLKRVLRTALVNIDVEYIDTAFKVEGISGGGNPGSVRHVSFISCYVLNCPNPWVDTNGSLAGSVMRCFFANCNGFGLINPVGVSSGDANARAGEGDTFLPGALWINEPANGQPAIQLRAPTTGQLLIAQDFFDNASPVRDSNPKNASPRRGLIIDASANDTTVIKAPRGQTTSTSRRLEIGNGGAHPDGPLRYVGILDPLYLEERTVEPANTRNGVLIHAAQSSALPAAGTRWTGPGLYARVATPSGQSTWVPVTPSPGTLPEKERNNDVTVSEADLGWLHRVNNAADRTVTIPEGLVSAAYPMAHFRVLRQGDGHVIFATSGTATLRTPGGRTRIAKKYHCVDVFLRFDTAFNGGQGRTEVYIPNLYPDADLAPSFGQLHRERNASYTLSTAHLGELHRGNHGSTDIVVTIPYGLWPTTSSEDVVSFDMVRVGNANFIVKADDAGGMTLRVPPTAPGVSAYTYNGATKYQYALGSWELRRILIRRIDATTGEVFVEGLR